MVIAYVPALVCLVGGLVYYVTKDAKHAKVAELARIAFMVGLFWTVHALAEKTIKLGSIAPSNDNVTTRAA